MIPNNLIAALFVAVLLVLCILILVWAVQPTMDGIEWREETYRVQTGDTLWSISSGYCPDGVDRREWIEEIRALNGMDGSIIYPGQRLTVLVAAKEG